MPTQFSFIPYSRNVWGTCVWGTHNLGHFTYNENQCSYWHPFACFNPLKPLFSIFEHICVLILRIAHQTWKQVSCAGNCQYWLRTVTRANCLDRVQLRQHVRLNQSRFPLRRDASPSSASHSSILIGVLRQIPFRILLQYLKWLFFEFEWVLAPKLFGSGDKDSRKNYSGCVDWRRGSSTETERDPLRCLPCCYRPRNSCLLFVFRLRASQSGG